LDGSSITALEMGKAEGRTMTPEELKRLKDDLFWHSWDHKSPEQPICVQDPEDLRKLMDELEKKYGNR
jgi:phenolic acid decarboxylase